MKYRLLGGTGILVSEIGFGAWGIGGITPGPTSYGNTNDKDSRRALRCALENEINFYDTSNLYGDGHSEILIGETFKGVRDRVIIATKAGLLKYNHPPDFSEKAIRNSLGGSLRRLQTDYIDILQYHNPPKELFQENDTTLNLIQKLKQEGAIRAFGVSIRDPDDGYAVLEKLKPDAIQVNFNLLDHRILDGGFMAKAGENGTSIIARTPLCFGFLTGELAIGMSFESFDHRSRWPQKQIDTWIKGGQQMLGCMSDSSKQTSAQFALSFCLSFPEITVTIPGMMREEEVFENAKASDRAFLSKKELEDIGKVYNEHNGFFAEKTTQTIKENDPGKVDGR